MLGETIERFGGGGVAVEGAATLTERHDRAEAEADVGEVAQGAGVVPFEDVGVEIVATAAPDGGDEVGEMIAGAGAAPRGLGGSGQRFTLVAAARIEPMAGNDAFFQVEHVANRLAAVAGAGQAT